MADEAPVSSNLFDDITKSLKEQGIDLNDEVTFDDDDATPLPTEKPDVAPAAPAPSEAAPVAPSAEVVPADGAPPVSAPEPVAADDGGLYEYIRKEYGESIAQQLQGKYRSDTELVKGLINAYHLVGQRDDDAAFGRQLKPYAQEIVQYISDRTKAKAQPTEPTKPSAPKFDPSWRQKIKVEADPTGKEVLSGDPEAIKQYNAWREHSQSQLESFLQDPETFLSPIVERKAQEIAEAKLREHSTKTADQEFAHKFVHSTKDWMFEGGQYTIRDGQLQGTLTPMGRLFTEKMSEATQLGISKAEDQVKYATTAVYAEAQFQAINQAQQRVPVTPAPPVVPVVPAQLPRANAQAAVYSPNIAAADADDCPIMEGENLATAIMRNIKKHNIKF